MATERFERIEVEQDSLAVKLTVEQTVVESEVFASFEEAYDEIEGRKRSAVDRAVVWGLSGIASLYTSTGFIFESGLEVSDNPAELLAGLNLLMLASYCFGKFDKSLEDRRLAIRELKKLEKKEKPQRVRA